MAQKKKTTAKKAASKKAGAKTAPKKPAGLAPEPEQKDYTPEFVAKCKARAEAGDAEGQALYGRALCNGWGVKSDRRAARRWLRKAAEAGNASGQASLGVMYLSYCGGPADEPEAAKWLRKAAEQGLPRAQDNLGDCYYNGDGVEKDLAKAAEWYRKAAEQGLPRAQCNLGVCYEYGRGVEKDLAKAAEWYRKAAEQGLPRAQCNLGFCYEYGKGVEKDLAKAVKWYRTVAKRMWCGDSDSKDKAQSRLDFLPKKKPAKKMSEKEASAIIDGIVASMVPIPGKNYWMGKCPVTQAEWEAVMGWNSARFKGAKKPVERVSCDDCREFLETLNAQPAAKGSGLVFRLPTDEEWEFAARAGAKGDYCKLADGTEITGKTLGKVAWYRDNSDGTTHPVGLKKPNAFGLYDMHGNVWEWTNTAKHGNCRVYCGGSWLNAAVESSYRAADRHWLLDIAIGFRLCADRRAASNDGSASRK